MDGHRAPLACRGPKEVKSQSKFLYPKPSPTLNLFKYPRNQESHCIMYSFPEHFGKLSSEVQDQQAGKGDRDYLDSRTASITF